MVPSGSGLFSKSGSVTAGDVCSVAVSWVVVSSVVSLVVSLVVSAGMVTTNAGSVTSSFWDGFSLHDAKHISKTNAARHMQT